MYSESFYIDPAPFWTDRAKLFSDQTVKGIEEADKNSGKFLSGLQLSKLLTEAGPYHRVVAVDQATRRLQNDSQDSIFRPSPSSRRCATRTPSADNMETVLRGAGLLATTQVKLKMTEETVQRM